MSDYDDSGTISRTDLDSAKPSWQQEGPGLGGPRPGDQQHAIPQYISSVTEDAAGAAGDGLLPETALGSATPGPAPISPPPETITIQAVTVDGADTATELVTLVKG